MASRSGLLRKSPSQSRESLSLSDGGPLHSPPGSPTVLPQALRRAADLSPARGVLYLEPHKGETHQSYARLLEQARRIGGGLRAHGLRPGDVVLLQLPSASELVAAFWGCILAGAVPAPATAVAGNELLQVAAGNKSMQAVAEPLHPAARRLEEALARLARPRILTAASLAPGLRSLLASAGASAPDVLVLEELLLARSETREHPSVPEDLALLLLTSGSTASPKAVMLSHANVLGSALGAVQRHGFNPNDVSLNWMPLEHVGGLVMFHLRDVVAGCQQIQAPTDTILQSPLLWLDLVQRYRVNLTWAPNFAFGLVNGQAEGMAGRDWDLRCLRFVLNGGETIVPKTARRFLELLAPFGLPETAMHPAWGMSETSSVVTYSQRFTWRSTADDDAWVEVGSPLPGMAVRIADAEDKVVPAGETGALQVRGVAVTSGYLNDAELTRASFTADGWLRTGDVGFLRDGQLTLTGREKDIVIVHGVNYSCQRIEATVEEVEGVETSFTAACATRAPGEQTDKLVVFFSSSRTGAEGRRELAERIRAALLRDLGVPAAHLVLLPREQIPKTGIGKIRRAELRRRFEAGEFAGETLGFPPRTTRFHRRVWYEVARPALASPPSGPWLLFADSSGLGEALGRQLEEEGHAVGIVVTGRTFSRRGPGRYELDPHAASDYVQLLECLEEEGRSPHRFVHLWTHTATEAEVSASESSASASSMSAAELETRQALGLHSVLHLARSLARAAKAEKPHTLWVVSNGACAVLPGEGVACEKAALLGLLKTLPREIPGLLVTHLDLAGAKEAGNLHDLCGELAAGEENTEIAYRDARRWHSRLVAIEIAMGFPTDPMRSTAEIPPSSIAEIPATAPTTSLAAAGTPIVTGGFYVVSGGLGGIGAALVPELLSRHRARLLVLGRTKANAVEETLRAWRHLGGEIVYRSVDITDEEAVRAALQEAERRWGPPDGVFHLAGAYAVRPLADETTTTLAQVLRAKVLGAWTLHRLLQERDGALFVSFSSLLGDFGGALHGAYAAANAFLIGLAHQQRSLGMRSHCLLWSSWTNTGMNRGGVYDAALRAQGTLPLAPAAALTSLWAALRSEHPHLLIGLDGSHPRIRRLLDSSAGTRPSTPVAAILLEESTAPRTETERQLVRIWAELLESPGVGVRDNFFECGGDSLLAVRVVAAIEAVLGIQVPTAALFRAPTIEQLAEVMERKSPRSYRVVPLHREGWRLPFFCLPGGQDDAMVFRSLAAGMDPEQPIYAVQAAVLDGSEPCAAELSVEEVASHFVKEIRLVQPVAPYRLGGHCLGGLVAFEVAQQLWGAGLEVELLALIDTLVYDSTPTHVVAPLRVRLERQWRELSRRSLTGKLSYLGAKASGYRAARATRRRAQRALAPIEAMHRRYHPKPYPGGLTLFLAKDSFLDRDPRRDPRLRWFELAGKGAEVIRVAGDHETLLHPPYVSDLAARLGQALARGQASPSH